MGASVLLHNQLGSAYQVFLVLGPFVLITWETRRCSCWRMSRRMGLAIGGRCISQQRAQITSLGLGGGALEVSLCYLRLVWVKTLAGVDLKWWLMGPEPKEPEGTWDRHTQIGSWVVGRRQGQVPRGMIQKGRTEAKTRHGQVIKQ